MGTAGVGSQFEKMALALCIVSQNKIDKKCFKIKASTPHVIRLLHQRPITSAEKLCIDMFISGADNCTTHVVIIIIIIIIDLDRIAVAIYRQKVGLHSSAPN